ncbi:hypothetical protein [Vandammella animalimorsus]|uniref:hypothetical protein n=1 Tax=Vandammella animalimorsus TaxID=2029117 RepID=UPI001EEE93D6|nr:hypothetical protein [Vandammella animalimorsus]
MPLNPPHLPDCSPALPCGLLARATAACRSGRWPDGWRLALLCGLLGLIGLLAACSSKPPPAQWQVRSLASAELAQAAYLDGDERVAQLEWQRARQQVARTGSPEALALLVLRQCAMQMASLDWQPCADFTPLAPGASAQARAYAAYLEGQALDEAQRNALPAPQQRIAAHLQIDDASLGALQAIEDPLSRLLAAALLQRRSAQASPELMALAIDTASAQGWRRPLLAWLLRQAQYARAQGLDELLAQTELRIAIVQRQGALASPSPQATAPAAATPAGR